MTRAQQEIESGQAPTTSLELEAKAYGSCDGRDALNKIKFSGEHGNDNGNVNGSRNDSSTVMAAIEIKN